MPNEDKYIKSFATTNTIQVRISDNIRMMAELHARFGLLPPLVILMLHMFLNLLLYINGKIIGVGNVSTPSAK
jgi:hypothetical protein